MLCPTITSEKGLFMLHSITEIFDRLKIKKNSLHIYFDYLIPHANTPKRIIQAIKNYNPRMGFIQYQIQIMIDSQNNIKIIHNKFLF